MNKRLTLISGALLSGLGVALGAIGAHAWKAILFENNRTDTFETAVKYQLYHGLALLVVGLLIKESNSKLNWAASLFVFGVLFFSGSLYWLCFAPNGWIVFFTPIGGMLLIAGWALLAFHFLRSESQ